MATIQTIQDYLASIGEDPRNQAQRIARQAEFERYMAGDTTATQPVYNVLNGEIVAPEPVPVTNSGGTVLQIAGSSPARVAEEYARVQASGEAANYSNIQQIVAPIGGNSGTPATLEQRLGLAPTQTATQTNQLLPQDYYVKPGETLEAYNQRIAQMRGDTPSNLANIQSLTQGAVANLNQTQFNPSAPLNTQTLSSQPSINFQSPIGGNIYDVSTLGLGSEGQKAQTENERLRGLIQQSLGESQFRSQAEQAAGLPNLQRTQKELESRLQTLKNEAASIVPATESDAAGKGITTELLGRKQRGLLRQNAIQALSVNSLLEASRGNISLSLDLIDRAVEARFGPIREQIEATRANLSLIESSPLYSAQEKSRAQAQALAQNEKERQLDIAQAEQETIWKIAAEAASKGADALTLQKIQNATSREQALNIAVQAGLFRQEAPSGTGTGSQPSETVQNYVKLLSEGKISLANVPQSIRNQVVAASDGTISKPLSDTAISQIQQSQSAVSNLTALKGIVEKNLQFVGPIAGLARFNPFSQARQIQAEIDRVRQQVGKTLEGGVLRKEDEEKYKRILATLADTPQTALYKIDSLISSIQRDIELYKNLQQETGRFVPGGTSTSPEDLRSKYGY